MTESDSEGEGAFVLPTASVMFGGIHARRIPIKQDVRSPRLPPVVGGGLQATEAPVGSISPVKEKRVVRAEDNVTPCHVFAGQADFDRFSALPCSIVIAPVVDKTEVLSDDIRRIVFELVGKAWLREFEGHHVGPTV